MNNDQTMDFLTGRIRDTDSQEIYTACRKRWDTLAKPLDGLGDLEGIIARIGGIQHTEHPSIENRTLLIFLSDNGIVEEGVSQCGSEVTHSVAEAMSKRSSTACVMAEKAGIRVFPVDLGMKGEKLPDISDRRIREGSRNFAVEPAMTTEETFAAIRGGAEAVEQLKEEGTELLLLGEMGIGNTSTATAVSCAILGLNPEEVMGRGAGLSDERLRRKCHVIRDALQKYDWYQKYPKELTREHLSNGSAKPSEKELISMLSALGGYDIAGMVGAILAAAACHIPVVLDGAITLAAALLAVGLCPEARKILIPSHDPREPMGHRVLKELGFHAVIHGHMALGEGTGAILLIPMLDVCMEYYNRGTSFDGLGIEAYQRFEGE